MNFKDVNFVGGKLRFKNPKIDKSIITIKKIAGKDLKSSLSNNPRNKPYTEIISEGLPINDEEDLKELEERKQMQESKRIQKENEKNEQVDLVYGFIEEINDTRTAAEKRFDAMKLKKLPEKIEKDLKVSFRQKYEDYNKNLNKLPEHYDIPKVGPG